MKWEIIDPTGEARFQPTTRRVACKFARSLSTTRGGRWTAREVGREATIVAGTQYRLTYEDGVIVERGNVARYLRELAWCIGPRQRKD